MKYFTPERLSRLQDHSDERQFLAALADWERVLEAYWKQLNETQQKLRVIQPSVSKNLHEFLVFFSTVSLHDARVLDMYYYEGGSRFRITLHPEFQPERLVVLTYTLDEPPQIQANVLPEQLRTEPIRWLYDELTLESSKMGIRSLSHSILLSDGSEVKLCFSYVAIERPVPLVPAVPSSL